MSWMGNTAESSPRDSSPDAARPVLASSRLCQLMEHAASRLMRPQLRDGESSVSVTMKLRYFAAAPGAHGPVRVSASLHVISGRLHRFVVNAFDERGLIAVGEHTRAVVSGRRFVADARRRPG